MGRLNVVFFFKKKKGKRKKKQKPMTWRQFCNFETISVGKLSFMKKKKKGLPDTKPFCTHESEGFSNP